MKIFISLIKLFHPKALTKKPGSKVENTQDLKSTFVRIFSANQWGSAESVSGEGSELAYTKNLRAQLPVLLKKFNVKKVLDAPCGDFNWMKWVVKDADIQYIGADIVPDLVHLNNKHYSSEKIKFINLDITQDNLPDADLMICRDCLFHLSEENIFKFIENFKKSNIQYLLTTTYTNIDKFKNSNINDGGFRLIDLFSSPFNFPSPALEYIDDWIEGFDERKMVLWTKQQLINASISRPAFNKIYLASALPSATGTVINSSRMAQVKNHQPGFLSYGPYIKLEPGNYEISISYISPANAEQEVMMFELYDFTNAQTLKINTLSGSNSQLAKFSTEFNVDANFGEIEFRTMWLKTADVTIHSIHVTELTDHLV